MAVAAAEGRGNKQKQDSRQKRSKTNQDYIVELSEAKARFMTEEMQDRWGLNS